MANQPPHPRWRELAGLLLEHGASPADEQALITNQEACLDLLLGYGLKPDAVGTDGITLMGRAIAQAARHGDTRQAQLLLDHHARTDEKFNGKTPWEHAIRLGHANVAALLKEAGAPVAELDEAGRFIALVMAADEPGARAMLAKAPDLLSKAPRDLVHRAVWTKRKEAVQLALDLGFDPNAMEDNAAIHHAGVLVESDEILRLLLERGASLTLRDPWYDSTAIGWADFFAYAELRDKLLNEPGIGLLDALDYHRYDRVPEILTRDPEALERPFAIEISREAKTEDWMTPLARAVTRGDLGGVRTLIDHGADTNARYPDGRSLLQRAQDDGLTKIAKLVSR